MPISINLVGISFLAFIFLMLIVGLLSASQAKESSDDYLLAGRNVNPWVMALSTLSTTYSGFMFIGYIGYTFMHGISAIWYLLTWALGDYIAWLTVHKKLRERSAAKDISTVSSYIGSCNKQSFPWVIKLASVMSFLFLAVYAAAQFKVSSKALHAMLGWDYQFGIIAAGVVVAIYCFSGGIRASIWTDVIQTILMVLAMCTLLFVVVKHCGGIEQVFIQLEQIDPSLVRWIPENLVSVFPLFILSMLFNGYLVVGQPHIMVRPMAIDDAENMGKARDLYMVFYLLFGFAALGVGLASRLVVPEMMNLDQELTLPTMAMKFLPEVLVGLILAGVVSAAVSTADSQIISCSASVTQDLFPKYKKSYLAGKFATVAITVLSVSIALFSAQNVFELITVAWAVLGCALGPLIVLRSYSIEIGAKTSIAMIVLGAITVLIWHYVLAWHATILEALPGLLVSFAVFAVSRFFKTSTK